MVSRADLRAGQGCRLLFLGRGVEKPHNYWHVRSGPTPSDKFVMLFERLFENSVPLADPAGGGAVLLHGNLWLRLSTLIFLFGGKPLLRRQGTER